MESIELQKAMEIFVDNLKYNEVFKAKWRKGLVEMYIREARRLKSKESPEKIIEIAHAAAGEFIRVITGELR